MRDRILLVTGRNAAPYVRKKASGRVHVCGIDVAALLSPERLFEELSKLDLSMYSMVIVPGLVSGNTLGLSKRLGIPVCKGTKHHSEIPLLLASLGEIKLSSVLPADFALERKVRESVERQLADACKPGKKFLMKIGRKNSVYLGGDYPMRVVAEIPDAPFLSKKELQSRAKYLVKNGADIVDIGMVSGVDNSGKIAGIVKTLRNTVGVPLSIDSMNPSEILAGVKAGVDLVLSIGEGNMEVAAKICVPFVVVPVGKNGRLPEKAENQVRKLGLLARKFKGKKVILDPVLSPLNHGFVESVKALSLLRRKYPKTPLFMGAGNVTELMDADSVGVNALLAGIASEIGVELLFTVEASAKTRGCVRELATAAKMMHLAGRQAKSPKDLGLNLLWLKDKRSIETSTDSSLSKLRFIEVANIPSKIEQDFYRIFIKDSKIHVVEYKKGRPARGYRGVSSEALYKKVCSESRISSEHAAYLGKELAKAEIALKLGKNHVQDEDLF
ncbi:MAG: dihydropteroate synthase-like protein [Candidatus Altiarchaeales archaeon]|nr:dihydropteroate synthase-like protein [Candidatus Altiarchaeales archaeon]